MTRSCCVFRRPRYVPKDAPAAGWPASNWGSAPSGVLRGRSGERISPRDRVWHVPGLPGTDAGSVKVTPGEYPGKGRGTGGVRCHRFIKGEDVLLLAWAGPAPAVAAAASRPIPLPDAEGRRDSSGTPASQPIAAVGSAAGG